MIRAAILRAPAPNLAEGERTHIGRAPIDLRQAEVQHADYARALQAAGLAVELLPALAGRPDACFVEDTALILPEANILLRPGAASRADEPLHIAPHLPADRPLIALERGRIDGGDVLQLGRRILVGLTRRTDADGAHALAARVRPHGYSVETVRLAGALHLKTAMTAVTDDLAVANRTWLAGIPAGVSVVDADPAEPFGANVMAVNGRIFAQWNAPVTAARIASHGFPVTLLDIAEFQKAEAGLTCLSLLVPVAA